MSNQRGFLVVIEGLDRAGKSTQCSCLATNLEKVGRKVKSMRFPGAWQSLCYFFFAILSTISDRSTPIGKSIDAYLKGQSHVEDHAIHLLFSANRWEAAAQIKQDIDDGFTVIIDRYSYSGAVYSAAKKNPELGLDWAWQPEVGLPRPDLMLFLDISPEVAAERGGYGDEKYETSEMQQNVRSLFRELLGFPGMADHCVMIDAGRPLKEVERSLLNATRALWENPSSHGPLDTLASLSLGSSLKERHS